MRKQTSARVLHLRGGRKWEIGTPFTAAQVTVTGAVAECCTDALVPTVSGFKGQETYPVDAKGRVNIPAKMRRVLAPEAQDTFVLTRGTDRCIVAYPLNEWRRYEERFAQLNQYDEKQRFFLRMILSWCEEVELDPQQRIAIPRRLLEFAGIEGKVTIVGMMDHLELWNPDEFVRYLESFGDSYEQVASAVMK